MFDEPQVLVPGRVLRNVGKCPHGFLAHVVIVELKDLDDFVHNTSFDGHLDLIRVACGDVRYRPAYFFADCLLGVGKQTAHCLEGPSVDALLGFVVITSQQIADRSEARDRDRHLAVV